MAKVIATITIMPESPDSNLEQIEAAAKQKIIDFAGDVQMQTEIKPLAFGLNSVDITFVMDEDQGSTEPVEEACAEIEGVNSAEVTAVRRALG